MLSQKNFVGTGACAVVFLAVFALNALGQKDPGLRSVASESERIPIGRSNTSENGANVSEQVVLYTVPAGKRLVIETISGRVTTAAGASVICGVQTRAGGQTALTNGVFSPQGTQGGETKFAFTHAVRLYAEAGSNVAFIVVRTDRNAVGNKNMSFSGYLEAAN